MSKVDNFTMDGYLIQNLELAKAALRKDWDMVICIDGYEGSGKSTIAMQCAYYLDRDLNLDKVTFTPEEFKEAILKAERFSSVVYDEGYGGLASRGTMSRINRALVSMMAEIRQKNLAVFIVLPSYFELDRNIALHRSRALIHVYTSDNMERGFFAFYGRQKKLQLYIDGKKAYNYKVSYPDFRGRFTSYIPVDKEEYALKKLKALTENLKPEKIEDLTPLFRKWVVERHKQATTKINNIDIARLLGISEQQYYNLRKEDSSIPREIDTTKILKYDE